MKNIANLIHPQHLEVTLELIYTGTKLNMYEINVLFIDKIFLPLFRSIYGPNLNITNLTILDLLSEDISFGFASTTFYLDWTLVLIERLRQIEIMPMPIRNFHPS